MPFVPAKCTQCGANIAVDDSKEAAICTACGTPFITEKAIQNFNITYNTTNVQNTNYNIEGGEVHIHREYDDAQTLIDNLKGLLIERGYAKNSDPVQKNFATLEEKFPTDYRTDEARWLVKKDEKALMRVWEFDREFFCRYADEVKDQNRIVSFRDIDRAVFDRNRHKITNVDLLYRLKDEYADMAAAYQAKVNEVNRLAKSLFFVDFTGDMNNVKTVVCEFVTYIEAHKNEEYDGISDETCDKISKFVELKMRLMRVCNKLEFGEDREFMQHFVSWLQTYYVSYARNKKAIISDQGILDFIPELKSKWGAKDFCVKSIVDYWKEFPTSVAKEQYDYLERTKNLKGVPKYAAQLQAEAFKKSLFGVKRILEDPVNDPIGIKQLSKERLIEKSIPLGVN